MEQTEKSDERVSEIEKRKNADKKARQFDFTSMVALSIEGAKFRGTAQTETTFCNSEENSKTAKSFSIQSTNSSRRNSVVCNY